MGWIPTLIFHVALQSNRAMLGVEAFPADSADYEELLGWLVSFGAMSLVGVEGTGAWGVGLPGSSATTRSRWWMWIDPTATSATSEESRIWRFRASGPLALQAYSSVMRGSARRRRYE